MRISEEVLHALAGLSETDRSVLSVYLRTYGDWDLVDRFIEYESKKLVPFLTGNEKEYLDISLSLLNDFLIQKKSKGYNRPGLAFFADIGADFCEGLELSIPPEQLLAVSNEAIIAPLAFELDEYEPVGVILADASKARILIVAGQVMEDMNSLKAKIHHLSKVGGWSQMRYQRRRMKQVKHYAKQVVSDAVKVFEIDKVNRIFMAGNDRILTAIANELPKSIKNRVIGKIPWDLDAGDDEFIKRVAPIYEKVERESERKLLSIFVGELKRQGLASFGIENVRKALMFGQVDTLILDKSLDPAIQEELVNLAKDISSYVEFIETGSEIMSKIEGVGAMLRYKI